MSDAQAVRPLDPQVVAGREGLVDLTVPEVLGALSPPATSASGTRESRRRRCLALADAIAITVAWLLSMSLVGPGVERAHLVVLAVAAPLWVLLNKALRLYDRDANVLHKSTLNELPTLAQSVTVCAAAIFLVAPVIDGVTLDRAEIIAFWCAAMVTAPALRWTARAAVRQTTEPERVLLVGSGVVASLVARKLQAHPEYGARVVGSIDLSHDGPYRPIEGVQHLGHAEDFEDICVLHGVERVIVAFASGAHEPLLDIIRTSKRRDIRISIVPRLFEVFGSAVDVDHVEGMTLLGLRSVRRTKSTLALKRGMDVVVAAGALAVTAPVLLAAMVAIRLTSPGPSLFVQPRVGRGGRDFRMYKLRTMVEGADQQKAELLHLNEVQGPMFKVTDDPRVTPVGRLLRRTSIDELPQLVNVLRGEMSIVGPRPLVRNESDHVIGWHRTRLDLMPGLTGPWQVMGRNAIPFEEMVKLDYLYVAEWSLWNDIKLMIRTLPVVLGRRGA